MRNWFWEKDVRARFEAKVEKGARVEAHTYEQVVEDTKETLLKLVSKDRAIIDVTVSFTSSLLRTIDVGLLYHGTIPDYRQKRVPRQDGY